jgi:hypothetical protein
MFKISTTDGQTIKKKIDKCFFTCTICDTLMVIGKLAFEHDGCEAMQCIDCIRNPSTDQYNTVCFCCNNTDNTPHRYTITLSECTCGSHVSVIKSQGTNENLTNMQNFQLKACNCDVP